MIASSKDQLQVWIRLKIRLKEIVAWSFYVMSMAIEIHFHKINIINVFTNYGQNVSFW